MTMTNQRRRELIDELEDAIENPVAGTATLWARDARDLLALLREDGQAVGNSNEFPYKVLVASNPWQKLHWVAVAAFNTRERAERWGRENYKQHCTITGPDDAPDPSGCPGCGGPTEYSREDPPNPYYCEKCEYESTIEATGCPPKSHTNTIQFTGIPENVVI